MIRVRIPAAARAGALALAALALAAAPARAQWPGEIAGTVVEAGTGEAVAGADVVAAGAGRIATTNEAGEFALRGLEPGLHALAVRRLGYAERRIEVEVQNGITRRVRVPLVRIPVEAEAVAARARPELDGHRVGRAQIERAGARTAGDVVALVPGAVVRRAGPGGSEHVHLRGADADDVLVLLDGVPINDPLTGEADLSTVRAAALEGATVLPGGRSARYGERASGGVVLLETRSPALSEAVETRVGSLGLWEAGAAAGGRAGAADVGAGGGIRTVGGDFDFDRPAEVGGGADRRENADELGLHAWASLDAPGGASFRLGFEREDRGLPGRSFAPSPRARRTFDRGRASAGLRSVEPDRALEAHAYGALQRVRHRDPAPPAGLPYDDGTTLAIAGGRLDVDRRVRPSVAVGAVLDGSLRRVDASALAEERDAETRGTGGLGLRVRLEPPGSAFALALRGRVDRDGVTGGWHPSHEVALHAAVGATRFLLAHRSAFSPPTLGDLFFREGVAVEANPDLRAERVPNELEAGVTTVVRRGTLGLRGWIGDVEDRIVWAPDFRFVWRPTNEDVDRRGAEAWVDVPLGDVGLRFAWSYARVTYDPDTHPDPVQVIYRPRHAVDAALDWAPGAWTARLDARWLGERTTSKSRENVLPGFWTLDVAVGRRLSLAGWDLDLAVEIDRLTDADDAFVFAFPEPGRTVSLRAVLRPPTDSSPDRKRP